jgi:hypothetical protein
MFSFVNSKNFMSWINVMIVIVEIVENHQVQQKSSS